jgi:hypothetical protein
MRWLYLTVVVLFVAATILFDLQNVAPVTMWRGSWRQRIRIAS